MNLKIFILLNFFWGTSLSFASSVFTSPNYTLIHQQGRVHVECSDGIDETYNSFWCEEEFLSPVDSATFSTNSKEDIDEVELLIKNKQGEFKNKWSLNPLTGATWWDIPLWGDTGILSLGLNHIDYTILNTNGHAIEKGIFKTTVNDSPVRQCRPLWIRSSNSFDCRMNNFACRELSYPRSECQ